MTLIRKVLLPGTAVLVILAFLAFNRSRNFTPVSGKGFAVVELFTSEGCSSCPPADELIASIQQQSNDMPVYILAYHVDYWNYLGWKDAFSNPRFSARQRQYAGWLKSGVYTPQVVVNGRYECVGSEEVKLRKEIKTSLQQEVLPLVKLGSPVIESGKISLQYQLEETEPNTSLIVALVEKLATSKVLRGENKGRTLSHVQIVRTMQTIDINSTKAGTVTFETPEKAAVQGLQAIAFIQRNEDGRIVAATRSEIGSN